MNSSPSNSNPTGAWTSAQGVGAWQVTGANQQTSQSWNGRYYFQPNGPAVPDGVYMATIWAQDQAGNQASLAVPQNVDIDGTAPTLSQGFTADHLYNGVDYFSPTSTNQKTTTFTFGLADGVDPWNPVSYTLQIKDQSGNIVRTFTGSGTSPYTPNPLPCWDGSPDSAPSQCSDATHKAPVSDGTYIPVLTLTDGGNNSRVVTLGMPAIVVDTTLPNFDLRTTVPGSHGNTVYGTTNTPQPVMVNVLDSATGGVDPNSLTMTIADRDAGTSNTYAYPTATYNAGTGLAQTPGQVLIPGHHYDVTASIKDPAGNFGTTTWWFLAISPPGMSGGDARLSGSGADTGKHPIDPTTGVANPSMDVWTFDPQIELSQRILSFSQGSAHGGWGLLESTINPSNLDVIVTIGGQDQVWPGTPPAQSPATVDQQFTYESPDASLQTIRVNQLKVQIPAFSLNLPVAVSRAYISAKTVSLQTSSFQPLCADPTGFTTNNNCSPDPVRFYLPDDLIRGTVSLARDSDASPTDDPVGYLTAYMTMIPNPNPAYANDKHHAKVWSELLGDEAKRCEIDPQYPDGRGVACWISSVGYPTLEGLTVPADILNLCKKVPRACSGPTPEASAQTPGSSLPGVEEGCIYNDGENNPNAPNTCSQPWQRGLNEVNTNPKFKWVTANADGTVTTHEELVNSNPLSNPSEKVYRFGAFWNSAWGFADGDRDEIGLHLEAKQCCVNDGNGHSTDQPVALQWAPWKLSEMPDNSRQRPLQGNGLVAFNSYYNWYDAWGLSRYSEYDTLSFCGAKPVALSAQPPPLYNPKWNQWYTWDGRYKIYLDSNNSLSNSYHTAQTGGDGLTDGFKTGSTTAETSDNYQHGFPQWWHYACPDLLSHTGGTVGMSGRTIGTGISGYWYPTESGNNHRVDGYNSGTFGHVVNNTTYGFDLWGAASGCVLGPPSPYSCAISAAFAFHPKDTSDTKTYAFDSSTGFNYASSWCANDYEAQAHDQCHGW